VSERAKILRASLDEDEQYIYEPLLNYRYSTLNNSLRFARRRLPSRQPRIPLLPRQKLLPEQTGEAPGRTTPPRRSHRQGRVQERPSHVLHARAEGERAKRRDENPRDESREMATFNTELNFILLHFLLFLLAHCSQPSFKMRLVFARRRQN